MPPRVQVNKTKKSAMSFKSYFTELWSDKVCGLSLKLTLVFAFLFLIILLFYYWRLPPEIPLTYSRPWGEEQLVKKTFLMVFLAMTLLIVTINNLLASFLYSREQLLAQILTWTGTLVFFLVDVTLLRVAMLVT